MDGSIVLRLRQRKRPLELYRKGPKLLLIETAKAYTGGVTVSLTTMAGS